MRFLYGSDWRILIHYRLAGLITWRYQQLPLSGSRSGECHHHLPYSLHDSSGTTNLSGDGEASARQAHPCIEPFCDESSADPAAEQVEITDQADDHQYGSLFYTLGSYHRSDVHLRIASDAQSAAGLAPPLVRQRHHRLAYGATDSSIPTCHRDEEESQPRVETSMGREQHQPCTSAVYGVRPLHHCPGFHLLHHQLPLPLHQCVDDLHRRHRSDADDNLPPHQEAQHCDGARLHP